MRDDKSNSIIKDFEKAKSLALTAVQKYLSGKQVMGDPDGFWHGNKGKNRALKFNQYLEIVKAEERLILLALFIAIFGSDAFWVIGRSNRLVELITEGWIKGANPNYTSEVFDQSALDEIGAPESEPMALVEGAPFAIYKKGVRVLLKAASEQPEFKKDHLKMQSLVKSLRQVLDNGNLLNINLQILPPTHAMASLYASAAMVGAFSTTVLPQEACIIIGACLTRAEAALSLVRVNRAASQAVKIPEVLQRDLKVHPLLYRPEFTSQHKKISTLPPQSALKLEDKSESKERKEQVLPQLSSSKDAICNGSQTPPLKKPAHYQALSHFIEMGPF